ncbi:MAG: hypothetical protein WKF97_02855 [Chitinophagaceae bacterium]
MKTIHYIILVIASASYSIGLVAQTQRLSFEAPYMYPEGVAYNEKSDIFYVSSVTTGTIGTVTAQGVYKEFYVDSSLKSSFGMKVDLKRNKLWVCTGDPHYSRYRDSSTFKKLIHLISLDLTSGKKVDDINLAGLYEAKHLANDLVLDDAGNIYITDSYSPVIYKLDAQMKPVVFAQSEWFKSIGTGLNGIVWSPKGFLIVAHNTDGNLYKVDIKDPTKITRIQIKTFFPGADGLLWDSEGSLVLVQNKGIHKIFRLASTDNWASAEVKASTKAADRFHQPTTAAMKKNDIYVLNSKMNELSDPTLPPSKEFSLQVVRFQPVL